MDRDAVSTTSFALLGLPSWHLPTPALWNRLFAVAGLPWHCVEAPLAPDALGATTFLYDFVYRRDGEPTLPQLAVLAPVVDGLGHLEAQAVTCLPYMRLDARLAAAVGAALTAIVGRAPRRWSDAA